MRVGGDVPLSVAASSEGGPLPRPPSFAIASARHSPFSRRLQTGVGLAFSYGDPKERSDCRLARQLLDGGLGPGPAPRALGLATEWFDAEKTEAGIRRGAAQLGAYCWVDAHFALTLGGEYNLLLSPETEHEAQTPASSRGRGGSIRSSTPNRATPFWLLSSSGVRQRTGASPRNSSLDR